MVCQWSNRRRLGPSPTQYTGQNASHDALKSFAWKKSTAKTLPVKNRKRHCETLCYYSDTSKDKFRLDRYVYQCSSWYRLLVRR